MEVTTIIDRSIRNAKSSPFPGFVPGITGGAYDLYLNPDPTGGFNPLPPPGSIPWPWQPSLSAWDSRKGHLFPDPGGDFSGSKASPAACRGLPTPNGREPPEGIPHTRTASTRRERQRAIWLDLEEGPEGSGFWAARPEASFSQP